MQADKVAAARKAGVAMGSIYNGRILGWTTDEDKAMRCREEGMEVSAGYNATGPVGWEIVAHPDPPQGEAASPTREKGA